MAKGKRGGRGGGRAGGRAGGRKGAAGPPQLGGRPRRNRGGGSAPAGAAPEGELPTAAPGAHGLPSSIMGGHASVNLPPLGARAIQRPGQRRRNRGGPRSEAERIARGPQVIYDFRYVRADLQWIALTSAAAVGAVLIAWLALRV
jgi:hypothetical protein